MRSRNVLLVACLALAPACTRAPRPVDAPVEKAPPPPPRPAPLRYVALGDSYTKGEAAPPEAAWPFRAAEQLRKEGHQVELVANLGVTGFTSQDVLRREVPELETLAPDVVTLQVGINDYVQGVDEDGFRKDLATLLDAILGRVERRDRLVVVTIPDFSVARKAERFGRPSEIHDDLQKRNAIIKEEAKRRDLRVADVFETSRAAAFDPKLLAGDGIHPSAEGYGAWVEDVLPKLREACAALGK